MEHYGKEFGLEVWGEMACFTRPELKVERVSYEVITPSAARAIFEAIFWKPAIRWEVSRIEVLNPIQWTSIRRNEVGAVASERIEQVFIENARQQKNTLLLKDVRYRIYARMIYVPVEERKRAQRRNDPDDNPGKYQAIFERRAAKGQCFTQPYLGTREFSAYFRLLREGEDLGAPLALDRDLGIMLYDMDFSDAKHTNALFFRANMKAGVIEVPPLNSKEVLR